jgi:chaperonin GroES
MPDIYETLEVIGGRVVARPLRELDLDKSGLYLPDTARMPQNRAIVEKVGPGARDDRGVVFPMPFSPGDVVFYQKFAGAWIYLAGVERLMLMEEEIQARIPGHMVRLVHHGEDKDDHLAGEPCGICIAAENARASKHLEQMREALVRELDGPPNPLRGLECPDGDATGHR